MKEIILAITIFVGGNQTHPVEEVYPTLEACQSALGNIETLWNDAPGELTTSAVLEAKCHDGDFLYAENTRALPIPFRTCRPMANNIGVECDRGQYATYRDCIQMLITSGMVGQPVICLQANNPAIMQDPRTKD
jgi:hypothetical protein